MKLIISFIAATLAVCSQAQTPPLLFQWHGQTMGVEFEATNLTGSAKNAIRDDIAYAMSLIPATNIVFEPLSPGNPNSSKYTGYLTISAPINYGSGVLCFYKTIGSSKIFQLAPDACLKYAAAMAVTNQYSSAVNTFSNYLHSFKAGIDTSTMTLAEKKALLWNPPLLQRLEETYSGAELEELMGGAIPAAPAPPGACPAPSILAFKIETDLPAEWCPPLLCCAVKVSRGLSGTDQLLFCYVEGTWRFSP
jgi:hypothetical protein